MSGRDKGWCEDCREVHEYVDLDGRHGTMTLIGCPRLAGTPFMIPRRRRHGKREQMRRVAEAAEAQGVTVKWVATPVEGDEGSET